MSQAAASRNRELAIWSIGTWETLFWIQTVQVGVGILSLPRILSEQAGHNGWMALPIVGILVQAALWMMIVLLRRFDPLDLYGIFRLLFGKWFGNALGGLFAFYCLTACGLVVRTYIEVVQMWLFPTTSTSLFYWLILVPILYLGLSNPRVLGRFSVITFLATIWMAFLLLVPATQMNLDYFLPLMDTTPMRLLRATLETSHSVSGFEVLLVFYPFVQNKKRALKVMSAGIWITVTVYLYITICAFGFYSQGQLQSMLLPTVRLLQIVQLPMIERIEHIGIATWSFLIVSTSASYLWAGMRYVRQWQGLRNIYQLLFAAPPLLIMAYWPERWMPLHDLTTIIGYLGAMIALLLAPLLLLVAIIRHKKPAPEPTEEEEKEAS